MSKEIMAECIKEAVEEWSESSEWKDLIPADQLTIATIAVALYTERCKIIARWMGEKLRALEEDCSDEKAHSATLASPERRNQT